MSVASHHAEWFSLIEVSGLFVSRASVLSHEIDLVLRKLARE
jgi:hypothetical protein